MRILQVKGTSFDENTMLQQYVARDLGPEGLKHVAGLIDVYNFLTQGRNQKQDVKIAAKQVLQRLGYGRHADDKDLQLSLLNTTLYLARTFVVSLSSKRSPQRRYTPLLVLESFELSTEEGISFEYHLGQEFYDAIYGSKPQHYTIPTPRVIGYHAVKSQQELLLTFYLGQHLAQNQGTCSMYFITLCTRSTLYALEELQQGSRGKNRTRNAQQVIYALERMEQDGLILRAPHPDIDLVLAVNVCLDKNIRNHLAPATTRRIDEMMSRLKGLKIEELRTKRRLSLQRLLNIEASKEEVLDEIPEFSSRLTFYVGNLMQEKHPKQDSDGSSSVENVSEKRW